MRRVYLIKESDLPRDLSNAANFGDLVVCLTKRESNLSNGMVLNRLRSTLRDYGEGDYVLYAGGEWSAIMLTGVVLKELGVRHIDLLVWRKINKAEGGYIPQRIVL